MKPTFGCLWTCWINVAVVGIYVVCTLLQVVVIPIALLAVGCEKACGWAARQVEAQRP